MSTWYKCLCADVYLTVTQKTAEVKAAERKAADMRRKANMGRNLSQEHSDQVRRANRNRMYSQRTNLTPQ